MINPVKYEKSISNPNPIKMNEAYTGCLITAYGPVTTNLPSSIGFIPGE